MVIVKNVLPSTMIMRVNSKVHDHTSILPLLYLYFTLLHSTLPLLYLYFTLLYLYFTPSQLINLSSRHGPCSSSFHVGFAAQVQKRQDYRSNYTPHGRGRLAWGQNRDYGQGRFIPCVNPCVITCVIMCFVTVTCVFMGDVKLIFLFC